MFYKANPSLQVPSKCAHLFGPAATLDTHKALALMLGGWHFVMSVVMVVILGAVPFLLLLCLSRCFTCDVGAAMRTSPILWLRGKSCQKRKIGCVLFIFHSSKNVLALGGILCAVVRGFVVFMHLWLNLAPILGLRLTSGSKPYRFSPAIQTFASSLARSLTDGTVSRLPLIFHFDSQKISCFRDPPRVTELCLISTVYPTVL